ncbi:hypothetical protein [Neokomagataea anthophila]|uniref:Uncharacterized protein n=1 Tax=Neokomagataea anthophila TaxID=2826925 RepID=A0ABS5E760_9PROT|nr:hypothetical protein [Neokomagataea anthophila]MBR0559740.1 hypothetical protein [Neokomagataea anthophila]
MVIKEEDKKGFEKKADKALDYFLNTVVDIDKLDDLLFNNNYLFEFETDYDYKECVKKWVYLNDYGKYIVVWLDFSDIDNFVFWVSRDLHNKPFYQEDYNEYKKYGYFN